jgi:O-antigen ligase
MISICDARTIPSRPAERLWRASALVLAVMPILFAIAHRSSPLLVSIAAALAVAASVLEGSIRSLWMEMRAGLRTPIGLSAVAFLTWAALSITWSGAYLRSLFAFGELLIPITAAFILALALPRRMSAWAMWALAASLAVACILVNVELATDMAWRRAMGRRWEPFVLNRPILTFLVISAPLAWFLLRRGQTWVAAALGLLLTLTAMHGLSGSAVLGLVVGVSVYLGARFLLKGQAVVLVGLGLLAAIAFAPLAGEWLDRTVPPALHAHLQSASSRIRVDIYRSFGAAVELHPIRGAGFTASSRYALTPAAERLVPEHRLLTGIGHPHNAALQIWVELGVVGALLAAFVLALVLRSWANLPVEVMAPRLALLAAAAAIALVGHGAWQGWWAATLGSAVVWFRSADRLLATKPS